LNLSIFSKLHEEGLIGDQSFQRIERAEKTKLFSLHWELRTILYLGVLLLAGGLGILIYQNIDSIGHQVILGAIALLCAGCFIYCDKRKLPFSWGKVPSSGTMFDYLLLLGCLLLLTFIAYLQAQYNVFGEKYGLATFIPLVILFFCAYYFDHLAVLAMAVTNFAAWMGIAITPLKIFKANDFADAQIIFAGLLLGIILVLMAQVSAAKKIKAHFSFTYTNFGMNILFVSTLAGMFHFDSFYFLWLLPLAALAFYFYKRAMELCSFYFILMLTLYAYVGAGYVVTRLVLNDHSDFYMFVLMYFIVSAVFMILFLIRMNKKIKNNDSL
jgi:hypothetical protein